MVTAKLAAITLKLVCASSHHCPYVSAARGMQIHPIAAGNVFRRIASKCVCQLNQSRFQTTLGKLQVGVACPAGAESVVHATRICVDTHFDSQEFVLLKVDFANAFNSISRDALLEQVRSLFPDLLPWVRWCYGGQPRLFHQLGTLRSCVPGMPFVIVTFHG